MWKQVGEQLWRWRGVFIVAPSIAGVVIGLRVAGLLQPMELAVWDQFFRLRPSEPIDHRLVIVEIRESDIQQVGQWPMTDTKLARLLVAIQEQKPRAIGLDLYRDLPVEPGYQELAKIFESTPNLIGIQKVVSNTAGAANNPPPVLSQKDQVGANDFVVDGDGKVRRSLLAVNNKDNQTVLTLGTRLALLYLAGENITLQEGKSADELRLGKAIFRSLRENDGSYVRADTGGYQILSNFRNLNQSFQKISMTEVLQGKAPANLFRDRIVLIGVTADSLGDFFLTPFSGGWGGQLTDRASGVAVHGEIASQVISAALDGRPLLWFWSEPIEWLWIGGWAIVGAGITWTQRYRKTSTSKIPLTAIGLLCASLGLVGGSYLVFLNGGWIPVVPGFLALTGSALVITTYMARAATSIRSVFSRYLTDEVVASLLETPQGLKLGGERRQATILVSDLRGFSAISERLSPEQTMEFINRYLAIMTEVINQYQGTINEVLGDGIFVIFGAPIQREDDTQRAVACAIAMQLAMAQVNAQTEEMGLPRVEMGIGLHTGEVLAGNIGSQRRAKYTVMGSTVNLASRIESYTVGGQILISRSVLNQVEAIVQIHEEMKIQPKGMQEPLTVYEVNGIGGSYNLALPVEEEVIIELPQKIPLQYTILEGKQAIGSLYQGSFVKLGSHTAAIQVSHPVNHLDNLKIQLLSNSRDSRGLRDTYAKVTHSDPAFPNLIWVRFTAIPPEVAALLEYLHHYARID